MHTLKPPKVGGRSMMHWGAVSGCRAVYLQNGLWLLRTAVGRDHKVETKTHTGVSAKVNI